MPEDLAFCTLVKIMFDYGLRDLFKLGLDVLHLRFYQLQRLTEGMNTIFHISLALLKASKKELLQLDFEGALKYFRVALPRRYRTEANAKELIHQAVKLKISHKRLSKYEKEFYSLKERELESQDPQERLEAEDSVESLQGQLERCMRTAKDLEDENNGLRAEYDQVKEMCRREVQRLESEAMRSQSIILNYKQICSDLSYRLDKQQENYQTQKKRISVGRRALLNLSEFQQYSPVKEENGCGLRVVELMDKLEESEQRVRQLELSLAQTKLELVEAQCRNQDLSHQVNS
ncbi:unnamed protein product [Gongylonema pulchrum]|uniref:Rab-GAP TBC domain-containing protein n=1 Tax=Gongylonema pulchrum TaxID=637853 RepID=A0A183E9C0_9BILA|nr:unnamed protein product [Gongylonema pulchrum]